MVKACNRHVSRLDVAIPEQNRKFRPSNGTVGEAFMDDFCHTCKRFHGCEIYPRAMLYRTDEPEYPDEWIYDADGEVCCTAHIPVKKCGGV